MNRGYLVLRTVSVKVYEKLQDIKRTGILMFSNSGFKDDDLEALFVILNHKKVTTDSFSMLDFTCFQTALQGLQFKLLDLRGNSFHDKGFKIIIDIISLV